MMSFFEERTELNEEEIQATDLYLVTRSSEKLGRLRQLSESSRHLEMNFRHKPLINGYVIYYDHYMCL